MLCAYYILLCITNLDRSTWRALFSQNLTELANLNQIVYCLHQVVLEGGRGKECKLTRPGPEFIKCFSCSTQLSMKFFLLINVKMPIVVGILTFMSKKNNIIGLSEPEKC